MAKLTVASLRLTMRRLARDGDTESYDELWNSIDVLTNLGLIDQKMKHAMAAEDDRLFQTIDMAEDFAPHGVRERAMKEVLAYFSGADAEEDEDE